MNDAAKSQDDHSTAALRGEPEAAGQGHGLRWITPPVPDRSRPAGAVKWCRHCIKADHDDSECWSTRVDTSPPVHRPFDAFDEAAIRRIVSNELARPPQAASGSSQGARSDVLSIDVVEQRLLTWRQRFMNKSGDRLALDDFMGQESIDDLIDFVCSPPAQSAEQGATPPAPAATPAAEGGAS